MTTPTTPTTPTTTALLWAKAKQAAYAAVKGSPREAELFAEMHRLESVVTADARDRVAQMQR